MDEVRRQFETNVFGLLRLTQLVLPGHAPPALGPDREPQLDGRPADLPRRRHLPRQQARGGGARRRAALRGARLRHRRRADRARADPDRVRRDGGRLDRCGGRRPNGGPYGEFNAAVAEATAEAYDRARWPSSAPAPRRSRRRSSARSRAPAAARYRVTPSAKLLLGAAPADARPRMGRLPAHAVPAAKTGWVRP